MMTIKTENWLGEFVSTIGTGDAILGGAIDGFAGFSNVGNDVDVYYTIIDGLDKETGIGTLSAGRLIRKEIHATLVSGIYVKNGSPLNLSGDAQIYGTANSKFLSDVYAFMAVAEGNTRLIKNIQELQINGHPLTASFNLTADDVEAVSKAGDTMTGNLFAPAVLVSSAQNASPNALTHKDYVDSQVATRAPMAHTHTVAAITDLKPQDANATANTLAVRDNAADIHARLLRTTYQDQSDMSGALVFRYNNSTDNYNRYCSNPAAVRNWIKGAKTGWDMDRRAYIEHTDNPMTEYHIPGKTAVITYLTPDGNYRITTSNGAGGAVADRLRIDSSGNLFTQAAIHEAGQRVYSPNNQPHYSHNHTAAQGNADIVAGSHSQIGTYMLAQSRANTVQTPGYTVAGSSLRPASAGDRYADGQSLAGTWKLLGAIWDESNIVANRTSLWIRIS